MQPFAFMEKHIVRILSIRSLTHDVRSYRVEKPEGYTFIPGQATEVCINKPGWEEERRPFTFTSLNDESTSTLEFTIKSYNDHPGVTSELGRLQPGDSLILHDVWGAISYQGPGCFIAGGAGITPFLAILRQLHHDNALAGNKLFFANKTSQDIILKDELKAMLGDQAVFILSGEKDVPGAVNGFVDEAFLTSHVDDFGKHFYVCGPPPMMTAVNGTLEKLGASPDALVFEK
jgi:ferredoxin-NADP reductase